MTYDEKAFWARTSKRGHGGCWLWTGSVGSDGYGALKINGRSYRAHRLAVAFAQGSYPKQAVLHLCGERLCCNPKHLREGTATENVAHMRAHGTLATGDRNGSRAHPECLVRGEEVITSKLTSRQVAAIRRAYSRGTTMPELARRYGVHKSTISRAVNGVQWGHV